MELFTITSPSTDEQDVWKLSRYLSDAFAELHISSEADRLCWDINAASSKITCVLKPSGKLMPKQRKQWLQLAASGLSDYIIDELELPLLRRIIRKESGYEQREEWDKIERYCIEQFSDTQNQQQNRLRRKQVVQTELSNYLMVHKHLNVAGLAAFRLLEYRALLQEAVEYAVDEFVMDKQYQDFIVLLRYFVGLQDTKTSVVHLIQQRDGQFQLYNFQFLPLEYRHSDRIVAEMLEAEMNVEDRVVSSLIAASPKQIMIHTRTPEQQVIRTIESIFAGRVTVCDHCPSCTIFFGEAAEPADHLST